jgi:hypothetical protein
MPNHFLSMLLIYDIPRRPSRTFITYLLKVGDAENLVEIPKEIEGINGSAVTSLDIDGICGTYLRPTCVTASS